MLLDEFDYNLPKELIASFALKSRSDSRLLILNDDDSLTDSYFNQLVEQINSGDLLILNNTKVINARLFGNKPTGGKVEVMLERVLDDKTFIAHIRTSKSIPVGMQINLPAGLTVEVIEKLDGLFKLTTCSDINLDDYLEQYGNLPLPPYMERQAEHDDLNRYQTVYAKHNGSVAAPTAGLHMTEELLNTLKNKGVEIAYVTLHVGSGTFKPVSSENILEHKMHSEVYEINQNTLDAIRECKARGNNVICVGTTSLRTIESVATNDKLYPHCGETNIFIYPGYQFKLVDRLITNFHLPKSTLLMLVSAFCGIDNIKHIYQHAINKKYRFFSYGDAMLLTLRKNN